MKRPPFAVILGAFLMLVAAPIFYLSSRRGPQPVIPKPDLSGLMDISIQTDKSGYSAGEPIFLTMTFLNTSQQEIQADAAVCPCFLVTGPDGLDRPLTEYAQDREKYEDSMFQEGFSGSRPLPLSWKPNQKTTVRHLLNSWKDVTAGGLLHISAKEYGVTSNQIEIGVSY